MIKILRNNLHQKSASEVINYLEISRNIIESGLRDVIFNQNSFKFTTDNVETIKSLFSKYNFPLKDEWFNNLDYEK